MPQAVDPAATHLRARSCGYRSAQPVGTLVVDTGNHFLYLVLGEGQALRYGIGVARDGFEWSGTHRITNKREWPDWTPPAEMLKRRPGLPRYMPGGPDNPLGARALYIGSTLYRIHGTNEPGSSGATFVGLHPHGQRRRHRPLRARARRGEGYCDVGVAYCWICEGPPPGAALSF